MINFVFKKGMGENKRKTTEEEKNNGRKGREKEEKNNGRKEKEEKKKEIKGYFNNLY